jgi:hypothetical protein
MFCLFLCYLLPALCSLFIPHSFSDRYLRRRLRRGLFVIPHAEAQRRGGAEEEKEVVVR